MTSSSTERFRTIAENLLTLEVNTIVTRGITAPKMPAPEHAIIEIVNTYRDFLNCVIDRVGVRNERLAPSADLDFLTTDERSASPAVFEQIRALVRNLLARQGELSFTLTSKEGHLLSRIWDNADQLKGLFERLPEKNVLLRRDGHFVPTPIHPEPKDIVLIRKMWELGTDVILTQTVIQIDGDVVTRLRDDLLLDAATLDSVLKIHDRAVGTSLNFWHGMVSVLGTFLRGVADLAFARK
jgi:hypothetical protein